MKIIDLENQTDITIDRDTLEKIAQSLTTREIELIVTDNSTIQLLNKEYRSQNKPTDVLSFPIQNTVIKNIYESEAVHCMPLGAIVISADLAKERSAEFRHSSEDELSLLFIHGLLHLLGFDHEVDHGEMREKEKDIIETFALPSSLIVRTEES
jgi:probable rRNA maturation factor